MIYELETTATQARTEPEASETLIDNWAKRVMGMWEHTRSTSRECAPTGELAEACQVRDSLNNRLERDESDSTECIERSRRLLESADQLFRDFTVEATTATGLSVHNHYAHRSEWWWRRFPRERSARADAGLLSSGSHDAIFA